MERESVCRRKALGIILSDMEREPDDKAFSHVKIWRQLQSWLMVLEHGDSKVHMYLLLRRLTTSGTVPGSVDLIIG